MFFKKFNSQGGLNKRRKFNLSMAFLIFNYLNLLKNKGKRGMGSVAFKRMGMDLAGFLYENEKESR